MSDGRRERPACPSKRQWAACGAVSVCGDEVGVGGRGDEFGVGGDEVGPRGDGNGDEDTAYGNGDEDTANSDDCDDRDDNSDNDGATYTLPYVLEQHEGLSTSEVIHIALAR